MILQDYLTSTSSFNTNTNKTVMMRSTQLQNKNDFITDDESSIQNEINSIYGERK